RHSLMPLGLTARNPGKNGVTWRHMASQPCAAWTYGRQRLLIAPRFFLSAITPVQDGAVTARFSRSVRVTRPVRVRLHCPLGPATGGARPGAAARPGWGIAGRRRGGLRRRRRRPEGSTGRGPTGFGAAFPPGREHGAARLRAAAGDPKRGRGRRRAVPQA